MTSNPLQPSSEKGRVVPFRPRGRSSAGWDWPDIKRGSSPVDDLAKYEQDETEDDYRHRMKMNVLGLLVTVVLMVAGMWLIATLAEMQKNQDCYLSGRRTCMPIDFRPTEHG